MTEPTEPESGPGQEGRPSPPRPTVKLEPAAPGVTAGPVGTQPDESSKTESKLSLAKDRIITDKGKLCPSCNQELPSDAVLCVHCGHDFNTGKKINLSRRSSSRKKGPATLIALIVTVVVAGGAYYLLSPEQPTPNEIVEEPIPPLMETPPGSMEPEALPSEGSEEHTPENVTGSPLQAAPDTVPDPAETLRLEIEQTLSARLDHNKPLLKEGDTASLSTRGGVVHSGTLETIADHQVTINEAGFSFKVWKKDLQPASRIQLDRAFRKRFIDARVGKELQKRLSSTAP